MIVLSVFFKPNIFQVYDFCEYANGVTEQSLKS